MSEKASIQVSNPKVLFDQQCKLLRFAIEEQSIESRKAFEEASCDTAEQEAVGLVSSGSIVELPIISTASTADILYSQYPQKGPSTSFTTGNKGFPEIGSAVILASNFKLTEESGEKEAMKSTTTQESSAISEFYRDRSVFITGGTGFLGKVLVEKLLRSCPKIKAIYLLMRAKKGHDIHDRLDQEFKKNVMFGKLIQEQPDVMTKIKTVEGDISLPNLGISSTDLDTLVNNVSVVFHSAATVRFNEELRTAVNLNVKGPQQLLHICYHMKHLVALVHVSTAFNNLHLNKIEEMIYETSMTPTELLQVVDSSDDESLRKMTKQLLGECPNTYTFTKALAEKLISEEHRDVPTAIVRPSIVTAALKEPLPGWIDNVNGPTAVIAGVATGFLSVVRCQEGLVADVVPVDIAINLMIGVAWDTATQNRSKEIKVFTCSTGQHNPITWTNLRDYSYLFWMKKPTSSMIWYPSKLRYVSGERAYRCRLSLPLHSGLLPRFSSSSLGQKDQPGTVHKYIKTDAFMSITSFFALRQWHFVNENFIPLQDQLSAADRQTFNFDVREIDWQSYIEDYCMGIRRYILNDQDVTIPAARTSLRKLYVLKKISQCLALLSALLPFIFMIVYKLF